MVIWGHAIMHFQPDYDQSYIFQTIYSFHMPLFMMVSGYFAASSMSLPAKVFFPKKFRQLLLPCLSWGIVCWLVITSGLTVQTSSAS
jgi:fucose 4-O-acetylase-like acetyltransferase